MGTVAVVPENGVARFIEKLASKPEQNLESEIRNQLLETFEFPEIATLEHCLESDFGLDIFVSKFRTGGNLNISIPFVHVPWIFWRPKIVMHARLYNLKSCGVSKTFKVTEKVSLREYFSRAFEWLRFSGFVKEFSSEEMKILTDRASIRMLKKISEAI